MRAQHLPKFRQSPEMLGTTLGRISILAPAQRNARHSYNGDSGILPRGKRSGMPVATGMLGKEEKQ